MGSDSITYGRLRDEVHSAAGALAGLGLEQGDRCALLLPTGLDFIRALYAVQLLGAAPVVINSTLPVEQLIRRVKAARCRFTIAARSMIPSLSGCLVAVEDLHGEGPLPRIAARPDDPAVLIFTSGTSGESRAAVILHRNLMASVRSGRKRLEICADDVLVNWVPLYHGLGLIRFVFGPVFFGCPVHLVPTSIANLRTWLETISRVRATITGASDFAFRAATEIVDAGGIDLRSLRFAISSGEAIRLDTIERFERKFGLSGVIRPVYGLVEANGVTGLAPREPLRTDAAGNVSCGRPVDGMEIEIVNEDGERQLPETSGEIRVRGGQVFAGYFDDEAANREKLRGGWLYTGDVGYCDTDGHLYLLGRMRSVIKRGGAILAPRDIEEAVERVDGVLASAAIGVLSSSLLGTEEVVVVAEIGPEADGTLVARVIAGEVSRSMGFAPREVVLVLPDTIPRTPNGKVRHEELKRRFSTGEFAKSGAVLFGKTEFG